MRKSRRYLVFGLALLPLHFASSTARAQDRERRDHSGFSAIEVSNGIDLYLRQGEDFSVEIAASRGDPSEVVSAVADSTLTLRRRSSTSGNFFRGGDYSAYVTLPKLEALTASGGSDVSTQGAFSGDSLRIVASGGSGIDIEVNVKSLEVEASGGSALKLNGSAETLRARTQGGSDLAAHTLKADEAYLQLSGGSDASVAVLKKIVAKASGGSDIVYSGDPETVDIDADRSADVRRR